MSSHAFTEADPQAEKVARNLNSDFQFIADRLPTDIKESSPYDTFTLCALEGVGKLWAKYDGVRPDRTGRAISEYVMKVGVLVENQEGSVEIIKDFGLTYQTLHREGPLDDLEVVTGEDLLDCPLPLRAVARTVRSLRKEFARQYRRNLSDTKSVKQLDIHRH